MKFCADHWSQLREEIKARGIYGLVATSGEEAAARTVASLEGEQKRGFDPLMAAHNMILSMALDKAGLDVMLPNEDGSDRCPLCFLQARHAASCTDEGCTWTFAASWIPGAAGDAYEEAKRLGLVGTS